MDKETRRNLWLILLIVAVFPVCTAKALDGKAPKEAIYANQFPVPTEKIHSENDKHGRVKRQLMSTGSVLSEQEAEYLKSLHNKYRALHNVPDVIWSSNLASLAQTSADSCLLEEEQLSRNTNQSVSDVGQIILPSKALYTNLSIIELAKTWLHEYDLGKCSEKTCKKFLQIVSHETREVGCGLSDCTDWNGRTEIEQPFGSFHFACNYRPRGEISKRLSKNCPDCQDDLALCVDMLCKNNCDKHCYHCGHLDKATCTCKCAYGTHGDNCNKTLPVCSETLDVISDCSVHDKSDCDVNSVNYNYMSQNCAFYCKICRNASAEFGCHSVNRPSSTQSSHQFITRNVTQSVSTSTTQPTENQPPSTEKTRPRENTPWEITLQTSHQEITKPTGVPILPEGTKQNFFDKPPVTVKSTSHSTPTTGTLGFLPENVEEPLSHSPVQAQTENMTVFESEIINRLLNGNNTNHQTDDSTISLLRKNSTQQNDTNVCNKHCYNCGELDTKTCTCKCTYGTYGSNCNQTLEVCDISLDLISNCYLYKKNNCDVNSVNYQYMRHYCSFYCRICRYESMGYGCSAASVPPKQPIINDTSSIALIPTTSKATQTSRQIIVTEKTSNAPTTTATTTTATTTTTKTTTQQPNRNITQNRTGIGQKTPPVPDEIIGQGNTNIPVRQLVYPEPESSKNDGELGIKDVTGIMVGANVLVLGILFFGFAGYWYYKKHRTYDVETRSRDNETTSEISGKFISPTLEEEIPHDISEAFIISTEEYTEKVS